MAFCNVLLLNKRWLASESKNAERENAGATIASV